MHMLLDLYHGTSNKIIDVLKPNNAYDRNSVNIENAVFATTRKRKAVYFGIRSCLINSTCICKLDNRRIFISSLRSNIAKHVFIYKVDPSSFVLDAKDEYKSDKDVRILSVEEYSLEQAIKEYGFEIYLVPKIDSNMTIHEQIKQMNNFIENENFQKLDITAIAQ